MSFWKRYNREALIPFPRGGQLSFITNRNASNVLTDGL